MTQQVSNKHQQQKQIRQSKQTQQLKYGIKCRLFKDYMFVPCTIYLDPWFSQQFLWIVTDQKTTLIDLTYVKTNCYSLQLQLAIKYQSGYKGQQLPRYIFIQQFNLTIPIIFSQFQNNKVSSQKDFEGFVDGKKPTKYFQMIQKIIKKRQNIFKQNPYCYSSQFSRFFKYFRLQMEKESISYLQQGKPKQFIFLIDQFIKNLQKSMTLLQLPKLGELIHIDELRKKVPLNSQTIKQVLKQVYCKWKMPVIKSCIPTWTQNSLLNVSSFNLLSERLIPSPQYPNLQQLNHTCFQYLMILQSQISYIIPEHKINLSLPLTDYYCFSSHNTYLTGNQLTSDCKVSRYIEDLRKGIKCVELDVHNSNQEPIITHAINGTGFCKPISFRTTIQAIDQFLQYHPNHYPIILSIENHASRENQDLMNNIILKQFNRFVVTPGENTLTFFKLQDLLGKVIIKTSCQMAAIQQFKTLYHKDVQKYQTAIFNLAVSQNQMQVVAQQNQPIYRSEIQKIGYEKFVLKRNKLKQMKQKFLQKFDQNSCLPIQKIAQITCLFKSPTGIQNKKVSAFQCTSMVNKQIIKTNKQTIINYTKKAWMRAYPEGTEIYSSNYDFLELLARGVQIIALNTQTNDDFAIMMNSYFTIGSNGKMEEIGYVQKPEYLRNLALNSPVSLPKSRAYKFTFFTRSTLQFRLYSPQQSITDMRNLKSSNPLRIQQSSSPFQQSLKFSNLKSYNQSFLIIQISKKWIQCLPLRFLPLTIEENKNNQKDIKFTNIVGRDYQFQDCGVRIVCAYQAKEGGTF